MRLAIKLLITLLAAAQLTACGKAGRPLQPPGSSFPRIYPNPAAQQYVVPDEPTQQNVQQRTSPGGSRIDSSVQNIMLNSGPARVTPGMNLPNTTSTLGNGPLDQGLGSQSISPLALPPPPGSADEQQ
jgi:hypothetical protein